MTQNLDIMFHIHFMKYQTCIFVKSSKLNGLTNKDIVSQHQKPFYCLRCEKKNINVKAAA